MTHSNPLLAKYEEIHGKKEEPKKVELEGTASITKEQVEEIAKYLTRNNYSVTSAAYSGSAITKATHIPTIKSYDSHSGEDCFLQIAEKIKNKDAVVTSMTMNTLSRGYFSSGLQTVTFEVNVYDIGN